MRMYDALLRLTQLLCICHYVNMVIYTYLWLYILWRTVTRTDRRRLSIFQYYPCLIALYANSGHLVNFYIYVQVIFS